MEDEDFSKLPTEDKLAHKVSVSYLEGLCAVHVVCSVLLRCGRFG